MVQIPEVKKPLEQEKDFRKDPAFSRETLEELRDAFPEGTEIRIRKLPEDQRTSPFYEEKTRENYLLFEPGEIDENLLEEILGRYRLSLESPVLILPYGERNKIGWETRYLYFALALTPEGKFNPEPQISKLEEKFANLPKTRIISFGNCNVACPYCKRDCQFVDESGKPIISIPIPIKDIARLMEGAYERGEIVRFSGGDPVVYPLQTLALAEYMWRRHETKVSIAHNGSGPRWVEKMLPYLSSAAIDLKGVPEKIGKIMGIHPERGKLFFDLSLETQRLISGSRIILDVRTPIFGDTTLEEMLRLAEAISENNNLSYTFWTWRMYKPVRGCEFEVPTKENTVELMLKVSQEFPDLWMGIRAKWERGGMIFIRKGTIIRTPDVTDKDEEEIGSGNKILI
jgi:pyruvate formate lyase activating enzyme